jgi:SPP1 gp7 family putative phage head morphogenesis protein
MPLLRAAPLPNSNKPVTLRPIHANAGLESWYRAELDDAIAAMVLEVSRGVLAAYGSLEPQTMAADWASVASWPDSLINFDAPANPSLLLRAALRKWGGLWVSKFDRLSLDLSAAFARKSFSMTQTQMRAALKEAGFTVKFDPTPASRAAYQGVVAEQVNLIKSIPAEYLKAVESKVWNSVMKGGDMHALSTELRKTYGVTRDRAATIARDQNQKAKATIEKTRREELGITEAYWQHSAGGKVPRATHVAMSGKRYRLSEGMYDSNVSAYIMPGELPNCRCTSKAIIPAFDTEAPARNTPLLRAAAGRAR